jgi:large subunit ribosomal protein L1
MADTELVPQEETAAEETEKSGLSTAARRKVKAGRRRHSQRFLALTKKMDTTQVYEVNDALSKVKEMATAKFDETVEAAVNPA